ncbi:hypothetical protein PMZ80_010764 [Knufia obscura]|uniref:Uncharacterized protein n=1 Tax=Knufia obscura TaxID=1635080 RepID=A0ABR0R8Q3_9EURO|nr:hypothetical protein PMZ80_010764 [Knufia obscura]
MNGHKEGMKRKASAPSQDHDYPKQRSKGVHGDVKLALTSDRPAVARADSSVNHDQAAVSNQEPPCISLASQLLEGFKLSGKHPDITPEELVEHLHKIADQKAQDVMAQARAQSSIADTTSTEITFTCASTSLSGTAHTTSMPNLGQQTIPLTDLPSSISELFTLCYNRYTTHVAQSICAPSLPIDARTLDIDIYRQKKTHQTHISKPNPNNELDANTETQTETEWEPLKSFRSFYHEITTNATKGQNSTIGILINQLPYHQQVLIITYDWYNTPLPQDQDPRIKRTAYAERHIKPLKLANIPQEMIPLKYVDALRSSPCGIQATCRRYILKTLRSMNSLKFVGSEDDVEVEFWHDALEGRPRTKLGSQSSWYNWKEKWMPAQCGRLGGFAFLEVVAYLKVKE